MKEFNEFIEREKPLQKVMNQLSESDGIMLESMFYEFAKQQTIKAKYLLTSDASQQHEGHYSTPSSLRPIA